ncbi:MAG: CRISPR-associated endonuclease Cas2 [Melioribacteraceae bacterium]|nr:CRISPR-associated endonuclease Cas2 [Melioribacteraceae bacterium]MCO6473344.1 CRISPR-associated endonuclease Cas2 [Melioribacteraceae bacterium]MDD3558624.1 CRISPR-associated endonuclease Cas2 [Melioribacteraceae bacterium]
MYLIVVYDAAPKRGTKLLKFLRTHLMWIQNSVFEGEVTKAQFEIIKKGIKDIINKEKDSVIYYRFDSMNYSERNVIGIERNEIDSFI